MNEKNPLNEISDSFKEIVDIMQPKTKKPNKVVIIGWIIVGVMAIYMLHETYISVSHLF